MVVVKKFLDVKHAIYLIGLLLITCSMLIPNSAPGAELGNSIPMPEAGGPYVADEGQEIEFDASGSTDPDGDELSYRWNFDGDWTSYSTSPYAYYTWFDDYIGMVILEVFDGTSTVINTATITINNVAPTVFFEFELYVLVEIYNELQVICNFWDPDSRSFTEDTHIATFDWGDGSSSVTDVASGDSEVIGSHIYNNVGVFTVTFTVTDDDDGVGSDVFYVEVYGVEDEYVIEDLLYDIKEMDIPSGIKQSMTSKVENAIESFDNNQIKTAINQLNALINQIEAQRGKKLSNETADKLIESTELVINSIS